MKQGKVIIVTGLIGSGKSSLSRELALALEGMFFSEPDELDQTTGTNPYLADFYADPPRWAFVMQVHVLNLRYRMHLLAQHYAMTARKHAIMDASYWQDTCYARLQKRNGTMSIREFETYSSIYQVMTASVLLPSVCVRLHVAPETAQERVRHRMETRTGRKCENAIDLDYLVKLEDEITHTVQILKSRGVVVLDVPWNEHRDEITKRAPIIRDLARSIQDLQVSDSLLDLHGRCL